eukprot:7979408-Lingulodinium_polyedra.AAC.1
MHQPCASHAQAMHKPCIAMHSSCKTMQSDENMLQSCKINPQAMCYPCKTPAKAMRMPLSHAKAMLEPCTSNA